MESQAYLSLPSKPGVYLYRDVSGKIIYVGKAKDLKKRVSSYFTKSVHDNKTERLVSEISKIDHIVTGSEIEAFLLEASLIKKHAPFFNIQFRDDKFYPYIKIGFSVVSAQAGIQEFTTQSINTKTDNRVSSKRFLDSRFHGNDKVSVPYIQMTRKLGEKSAEYFGPYTSADNVKTVLKIIRRLFPYQSVKNHPNRNCLYYHLRLCPCIPAHPENLETYKKNITRIKKFLNGQTKSIIEEFEREQKASIKVEEFERAAEIQKKD